MNKCFVGLVSNENGIQDFRAKLAQIPIKLLNNHILLNKRYMLRSNIPANISTSHQGCFNVADQRWNNVDPTLKRKQNPTSDLQRCTTLIQRQCPTLKQRRNNVAQGCINLASRLVKAILNPIGLVMSMDFQIDK